DALESQVREVVAVRHAAWRELYLAPHAWAKHRIARAFGVDHSTVFYAMRKLGAEQGGCAVCGKVYERATMAAGVMICGVGTSLAYHHKGSVCVQQVAFTLRGEGAHAW